MRNDKTAWIASSVKMIKYFVIVFVVILLVVMLNPLVVIDAWKRWVVFSKFGWVKSDVLWEWIHLRIPLVESITQMDVRTQKIIFTNNPKKYPNARTYRSRLDSASADLQDVYVDVIFTYSLDKSKVSSIYQNVWLDYEAKKIIPNIISSVKTNTAKFKVAEILTNREKITTSVEEWLKAILEKEWFIFEWVSLANFDFNTEFKKSIEDKQIAEQRKEKENYELERVAIEAQQKVKKAEAEAEARIKIAEWEKKAKVLEWEWIKEYNVLVKQEINDNILKYKSLENELNAIEKWTWAYPTYYMWGEGWAIPLINLWK